MQRSFADKLQDYAALTIRLGINIQPGQELFLTAPVADVEFVRLLVAEAYQAGAKNVQVNFVDDIAAKSRFIYGSDEAVAYAPKWFYDGVANAMEAGAARLGVISEDPGLLSDIDPAKVSTWYGAAGAAAKRVGELVGSAAINWSLVAVPNPRWARLVFPGDSDETAVAKLWEAIFTCCRVDQPDPLQAWRDHCDNLALRRDYLNQLNLTAVCFRGPGTDLEVGLVDQRIWIGGWGTAKNGVTNAPNIPTEEIFSMPHRDRVQGTVSSTLPLSLRGQVVDKIQVEFKDGVVVRASAGEGEKTLIGLLDTDEGSRRLGEVALVPPGCAVARTGLLFTNTLYDENAACHIALGSSFAENMMGYDDLSADERLAAGSNDSRIHVDWMIGSREVEVDGILPSGERKPLMRGLDWVEAV
ncbi:MAG: aminopeptidase [Armatimonadetes bacterium]|nr:aminopeptidase [Armatimonadota bacterium]